MSEAEILELIKTLEAEKEVVKREAEHRLLRIAGQIEALNHVWTRTVEIAEEQAEAETGESEDE